MINLAIITRSGMTACMQLPSSFEAEVYLRQWEDRYKIDEDPIVVAVIANPRRGEDMPRIFRATFLDYKLIER
jgi:hypothetical protein